MLKIKKGQEIMQVQMVRVPHCHRKKVGLVLQMIGAAGARTDWRKKQDPG